MKRRVCAAALLVACSWASAEEAAPMKARTFALVSAIGDQFASAYEAPNARTGTRLDPYRRNLHTTADNALNRLVLASLDQTVGKLEPASKRVYLAVAIPRARADTAPAETLAIETVLAELRAMPERVGWDRIVVATPAYRSRSAADGLPGRLQGAGIVLQGACQSEWRYCDIAARPPASGQKALTPEGEEITASRYVAPYLSIKVWVLDPRTLEVIDSQEVFEQQKYFDPKSDSWDMTENVGRRFLATKIVELVEKTTRAAVMSSELRGRVEVKERGAARTPSPLGEGRGEGR